jgi:endonuclease YncB( thermonuclease family)
VAALVLVLLAVLPGGAAAQIAYPPGDTVTGPAVAEEGDIVTVRGRTLRLYGIDAPEMGQTCQDRRGQGYDCGAASRRMLERFVEGRELTCHVYALAIDGLDVGRCFAGNTDIGGLMVLAGWAFSYRQFSDRYESVESRAQSRRRGFWEGRVIRPWVWRTEQMRDGAGG